LYPAEAQNVASLLPLFEQYINLMEEINSYLFVYGTLLTKGNEFSAYLNENCNFYSNGKVIGKLYDAGEYPGAILDPGGDHFVYGNIYFMPHPTAILKKLDYYEGFGEDEAQPNEFVRRLTTIESLGKLLECWMYEYNLPVDGLTHIVSGDYLEYVRS
jgi:gamma-glutamylcyclotransferase (GGCT)/AIG2-like uncharacterized protein YtfP